MKKTTKFISVILVAAMMLLMMCSCANTSYICTVDGVKYPVGPYAFYAYYTRDKYEAQIAQYYGSTAFASALVSDVDTEGTKMYEYINSEVMASYVSHIIVNLKFEELGLELTEDQQSAIKTALQENWIDYYTEEGFADICRVLGITSSEFEEMVSVSYKYESLMSYLFGEGGEYEITEEELKSDFEENYERFRYIAFTKVDPETSLSLTTDELIAKKALVDDAYARALAGEDFGALVAEFSEDYIEITDGLDDTTKASYEETNRRNREDGIVTDKEGIFDYYYYYYYNYYLDSAIVDKVFTMEVGDIALIELSSSFWIIQKLDKNENESFYESKKDLIYSAISTPIIEEVFVEWEEDYAIVFNDATVNKYDPRKIEALFYQSGN
ncbi:MAG: hypothetical protein IJN12_02860 [Clostridia bacterium]|nr:hypothetical protein [Clostridia bacterium]